MLDYVYLQTFDFTYTVGQTRVRNIAIIHIERSYPNYILQVSMDRIIDIFGEKNHKSFMRSARVLIICYILCEEDWFNNLNCVLILYKLHCVGFHLLFRCNRVVVKKSFFKNLCQMYFLCKVLSEIVLNHVQWFVFLNQLYTNACNRYTQKCDCFQSYFISLL